MTDFFSDRKTIGDYAERTTRLVPGLSDMQRMAGLLLAERSPADARVLVVGAGGGLELKLRVHRHRSVLRGVRVSRLGVARLSAKGVPNG